MIQSHIHMAVKAFRRVDNVWLDAGEVGKLADFVLLGERFIKRERQNVIHLQIEQTEDLCAALDEALRILNAEPGRLAEMAYENLTETFRKHIRILLTLRSLAFRLDS